MPVSACVFVKNRWVCQGYIAIVCLIIGIDRGTAVWYERYLIVIEGFGRVLKVK